MPALPQALRSALAAMLSKVPVADRQEAFNLAALELDVQEAELQEEFNAVVPLIPPPRYLHRTDHLHVHRMSCGMQARLCVAHYHFF